MQRRGPFDDSFPTWGFGLNLLQTTASRTLSCCLCVCVFILLFLLDTSAAAVADAASYSLSRQTGRRQNLYDVDGAQHLARDLVGG